MRAHWDSTVLKIAVQRVRHFPEKEAKDLSSMKIGVQRAKRLVKPRWVLLESMLVLSSRWYRLAYKQTSNPGRLVLPRIWQNVQEIYPS